MADDPQARLRALVRNVQANDVVQLRKAHPCGSSQFRVTRVGADVGLCCLGCDHRIMLPRSEFERRVKAFVSQAGEVNAEQQT